MDDGGISQGGGGKQKKHSEVDVMLVMMAMIGGSVQKAGSSCVDSACRKFVGLAKKANVDAWLRPMTAPEP